MELAANLNPRPTSDWCDVGSVAREVIRDAVEQHRRIACHAAKDVMALVLTQPDVAERRSCETIRAGSVNAEPARGLGQRVRHATTHTEQLSRVSPLRLM
jgi:hypothetical protein